MPERSLPSHLKIAFAIRDDDISYFTQPRMIDQLYRETWRLGFKVSLGVIPNIKATPSNSPLPPEGINKCYSISDNTKLVNYLKEKIDQGKVDIIQHGYTHSNIDGEPEFAIKNFELVDEWLRKGNRLLRETFGRDVTVFAAPHDRISSEAWRSIARNGMCLCRRFTMGRFLRTVPTSQVDSSEFLKTVLRQPNPSRLMPDSIIELADAVVIQWYQLFSSKVDPKNQLANGKRQFVKRLRKRGTFVTLHHHWDYFSRESGTIRQDLLASFNSFLNFVSSFEDVWKTSLSEICSWVKTREGARS
jgi:hypothetical protein